MLASDPPLKAVHNHPSNPVSPQLDGARLTHLHDAHRTLKREVLHEIVKRQQVVCQACEQVVIQLCAQIERFCLIVKACAGQGRDPPRHLTCHNI